MKNFQPRLSTLLTVGLIVLSVGGSATVLAQQAPTPTVPQRMTLEGEFVRLAYNNEGYVKVIPLATARQFAEARRLSALNRRADVVRDSVNYFPIRASRPCRLAFFSDPSRSDAPNLSWDQVGLSPNRA